MQLKKMKKLILFVVVLLFVSCSKQKMFTLMSKSPKVSYTKPHDYNDLNLYQKDAIYLAEIIKQSYPRLYSKISEIEFTRISDELVEDLGIVTNQFQYETLIKKYIAKLEDGHSNIVSFAISLVNDENYFNWHFLKENNKWIINLIDKSLDSTLVGLELISINGLPMKEIEKRVNLIEEGENQYYRLNTFKSRVVHPKYWKALEVNDNEKQILFSVKRDGKIEEYHLKSKPKFDPYYKTRTKSNYPYTQQQNNGFYYTIDTQQDFAYLQMNTCLDYVSYKSEIKNYTNFLFRPFAMMFLKKDTKDARNFGIVLQNMFTEIHSNAIDNLIIDLRYNGGGDERLGKQLIWYLTDEVNIKGFTTYIQISEYFKKTAKVDFKIYSELYENKYGAPLPNGELNITEEFYNLPYFDDITKKDSPYLIDTSLPKFKGNVYVLVGAETFSAAQWLATTFADNKLAKIVGTPVGNRPTCQTGASVLKLPNTKSILGLSYTFAERPDKSKNQEIALFPDIEVYQTYNDLINGIDSEFEAVLKEIKK